MDIIQTKINTTCCEDKIAAIIPSSLSANVAKLVYALDLGSCGSPRESSSLSIRTT
jgi:hypothetical protein